jgi:hypothetical protein
MISGLFLLPTWLTLAGGGCRWTPFGHTAGHTWADQCLPYRLCALKKAIREYIDAPHDNPKPFVWTKTAHEILASIARLHSAP